MSKVANEKAAPALKVTARYAGHYGGQHIREGQSFDLVAREDFAASWMKAEGWDPKTGTIIKGEAANTET